MQTRPPIVVVGAGPTGLAVVLQLARAGVPSVLLDGRPGPDPRPRASLIYPRTQEVLQALGLGEAVMAEGLYTGTLAPWWPEDRAPLAQLQLGDLGHQTACAGLLTLPQARLEALMLQALAQAGGCEVRWGHALLALSADPQGEGAQLRVQPRDGAAYTLAASVVVGCDGARSRVREQMGSRMRTRGPARTFVLADIGVDPARDRVPSPRVAVHQGQLVLAGRHAPGQWRLVTTVAPGSPEAAAVRDAHLRACAAAALGPEPTSARPGRAHRGAFRCSWAEAYQVDRGDAEAVVKGCVALAGDAAHTRSPVAGQGLNHGIQDAHNLAPRLALAHESGSSAHLRLLLDAYAQERGRLRGRDLVDDLERLLGLPGVQGLLRLSPVRALGRRLAGVVLARADGGRAPSRRRLLLGGPTALERMLPRAWLEGERYHRSPLVLGRHPLAGARAPNPELVDASGAAVRLMQRLGPGHGRGLVVVFDRARSDRARQQAAAWARQLGHALASVPGVSMCRIVAEYPSGEAQALWDAEGQAFAMWRVRHGSVAIVRPDGHIGWIGHNAPDPAQVVRCVQLTLGLVTMARPQVARAEPSAYV